MNRSIAGLIFLLCSFIGFNAYSMQNHENMQPTAGKYTKEIVGSLDPEDNLVPRDECAENKKAQDFFYYRFMSCWTSKLECPSRFSDTKIEGADKACYKRCARWMGCRGPLGKDVEMEE